MASANLQKHMTKTACCGVVKHNYRDHSNHSNTDIDPDKKGLNEFYGPQTSAEFREKYRSMVRTFDERKPPQRKKADRKTSLGVEIPAPREGMTYEDERRWCRAAYEAICEMFPGQVVGGAFHADEKHKYHDPSDGKDHLSRGHLHVELIPWTEEKGLNMDAFYKRSLPTKINERLDALCFQMFGYPFMDGTGRKDRRTMEQVKQESAEAKLEKLQRQIDAAEEHLTQTLFEDEQAQERLRLAKEAEQSIIEKQDRFGRVNKSLQNQVKRIENSTVKEELSRKAEENAQNVETLRTNVESVEDLIRLDEGLTIAVETAKTLKDTANEEIEWERE